MALLLLVISVIATLAVLAWLYILLHPARPWDFFPIAEDMPQATPASAPAAPFVRIVVPARNEATTLPQTLPALLTQDYAGNYEVVLVDDRSQDGTAEVARKIAADLGQSSKLKVITGEPLPSEWVGKVWAMQQGTRESQGVAFFLLTDADIRHSGGSLRRLGEESTAAQLALNSRMAYLNCHSAAEKLLIPPFVFFFNLLYPMRRVNNPGDALAGAAGGCMLLSAQALQKIGGFSCIRGALIDDCSLARAVKSQSLPIRLCLSRSDVISLRQYPRLGDIWKMVRRSAFTELKYSWLRLAGALAGLGLMFVVPLIALAVGAASVAWPAAEAEWGFRGSWALLKGALALGIMFRVYAPAVRFFKLSGWRAMTLPLAGVLYGLMTLDSALRYSRGAAVQWRERSDRSDPSDL